MEKAVLRAKSSARKFGGKMEDYLELHRWFDETEYWVDGEKHMAFRHHTQGIFEAEQIFGYTILNSEGRKVPTRTICEIHITEDLGFIPTAQEWVENLKMSKWMGFRDKDVIQTMKDEMLRDVVTKNNLAI